MDAAKRIWTNLLKDLNKEVEPDVYNLCVLELNIIRFENNILVIKASNKDIIEKLPTIVLDILIKKHYKGVKYHIVTKTS